jgi:hypothetical protein
MANPNELQTTAVYGNNDFAELTTTPYTLVNNPASSGKLYRVNSVVASSINSIGTAQVSLSIYSEDDLGGTAYPVVSDIVIPFAASLILVDSSSTIYLKEDQSIGAVSSGNNEAVIVASWEEVS